MIRERSLPLTWTGISISSAFASSSSILGKPRPVRQHSVLVADQLPNKALRPCAEQTASASAPELSIASRTAKISSSVAVSGSTSKSSIAFDSSINAATGVLNCRVSKLSSTRLIV